MCFRFRYRYKIRSLLIVQGNCIASMLKTAGWKRALTNCWHRRWMTLRSFYSFWFFIWNRWGIYLPFPDHQIRCYNWKWINELIYISIKLSSDEGVMPKHENTLACRCGELMGRKHSRFDAYFTALVSGTVE